MDELISGGISGAISDPYSDRAREHAKRYYEEIRNNTSHSDVTRIAENTGYSFEQILQIKNYLFVNEHLLDGKVKRFMPSFEIAQSWQRLAFDPSHILPLDLTLLKHEIREMELVNQGYSQSEAHKITSQDYNYAKESREHYKNLGCKSTPKIGQNSGAIKRNKHTKTNWEERY